MFIKMATNGFVEVQSIVDVIEKIIDYSVQNIKKWFDRLDEMNGFK